MKLLQALLDCKFDRPADRDKKWDDLKELVNNDPLVQRALEDNSEPYRVSFGEVEAAFTSGFYKVGLCPSQRNKEEAIKKTISMFNASAKNDRPFHARSFAVQEIYEEMRRNSDTAPTPGM